MDGGCRCKNSKILFRQMFSPFQAICNIFHFYDFPLKPKIRGVPHGGGEVYTYCLQISNFIKIRLWVVEKINFEFWYAILYHSPLLLLLHRNTGVALASAEISVGLVSWGLARLTDNPTKIGNWI